MAGAFFGVGESDSDLCFSSSLDPILPSWNSPFSLDFLCDKDKAADAPDCLPIEKVKVDCSPSHESDSGLSSVLSVGSPESLDNFWCNDLVNMEEDQAEYLEKEADLLSFLMSPDAESDDTDSDVQEVGSLISRESSVSSDIETNAGKNRLSSKCVGKQLPGTDISLPCVKPAATSVRPKVVLSTPVQRNLVPTNKTSVKVLKVVAPAGSRGKVSSDEIVKAIEDKNKKNAENAKMNREKKKSYIKGLEDEVSCLKEVNSSLRQEVKTFKSERDALVDEISYLKSVLANESSLSNLLKNIPNVSGVKLSSSFSTKKRPAEDHDYFTQTKKQKKMSGVCLHVDSETVSLEFCYHCANMASSSNDV